MDSNESIEVIAQAITMLNDELRATQLAQQLIAIQLHQLTPEHAEALAGTMENIAEADEFEASDIVREHLAHLSRSLKGDLDTPLIGLQKPEPKEDDPLHWLRGVIDGGKK
ncbi:hypothetical protein I6M59_05740 [Shewanella algae]|uniref:hypothetical protein n=1 Tax=Shewanella algae TaxID=38313 RepID=UPI001AACEDA7|nr:hypothetical protein [Shewanella algae]MBO2691249.1 hypothetical protein [Shewanella algae]QTE91891.1 hypothetical protein JKK33_05820 [Shewanella algae]